jgi:phosphoserine phosphatase RsbU/P
VTVSRRMARRESERKLRRIQAVTDAALAHLGVEDLLTELLERTRDLLDVDSAAVLLLDPSATELVATAASGAQAEGVRGIQPRAAGALAARVAATGQPIAVARPGADDLINQGLRANGVACMLGVPMVNAGQLIGVLQVGAVAERQFTDDDTQLLQMIADRAATAVVARLSRLDLATALALQRSLLPSKPPAVIGLDVAARYIPGGDTGVGGDWYDLFQLPSGHVGVAIGDIAGNGLRAAVVMGRIRSALRAYALESTDPADVLGRLDRKIQVFEPQAMATALYVVIDPHLDSMSLSSAGHLPPILACPDRSAALVDVPVDLPLGAATDARRRRTAVSFPPGGLLFLYTDGLVERRGQPIMDGIARLRAVVNAASAEQVCGAATATLLKDHIANDDIAILAVHRG